MTTPTTMAHITLDTGHVRQTPRSEVSERGLRDARTFVERALRRGDKGTAFFCDLFLTASVEGNSLMVTAWRRSELLRGSLVPILTFGVAPDQDNAALLWQHLHDYAVRGPMEDLKTDRDAVPDAPWVAARLDIGVVDDQGDITEQMNEAVAVLADFERCVAWAWLEDKLQA